MIYRTDYHMHTIYSDGRFEPHEYIEAALKLGISEIGFSDHLHPGGGDLTWSMDHKKLPGYVKHILRLKEENSNIVVRLGLEMDYIPGMGRLTEKIINAYPFDFIIGSVHYMGGETVDHGPEFYQTRDVGQIYEEYFRLIAEAASTGYFDIMGHPDLVRIHGYRPEGDITWLYEEMASALKRHDVAIELNTNGRNKPLREFYPDSSYLGIFAAHGVPVCVNSDAHYPERVGQFQDEGYELLRKAGYREMALFEGRRRELRSF